MSTVEESDVQRSSDRKRTFNCDSTRCGAAKLNARGAAVPVSWRACFDEVKGAVTDAGRTPAIPSGLLNDVVEFHISESQRAPTCDLICSREYPVVDAFFRIRWILRRHIRKLLGQERFAGRGEACAKFFS
jgi:hypothetical protein